MLIQRLASFGSILKKAISVTLAFIMVFGMVTITNVFSTKTFAAEPQTEGDFTYVVLDDGTAQITKYNGTATELTIPATLADIAVSQIGKDAFYKNATVRDVVVSEGITTIGDDAFWSCSSIKSITFPSSVTSIGSYAFYQCTSLTSVDIPSTVKTTGNYAFGYCSDLTAVTLHEGLEKMGTRFLAGTAVSSIYIPTTVTSSDEALAEMRSLTTVTFGEGITAIPDDLFEECNGLTEVTIPATVTTIGKDAFCQMASLESIVIPDTVTEIGKYAFYECKNLKNVTIGKGLTKLPDYVFASCTSLTQVDIPSNITEFGWYVFNNCSSLTDVTLHEGLADLGYYAFAKTGIAEITTPSTVTEGHYPFEGCANLKSLNFADGVTTLLVGMCYNTGIESIVIPEGVTELPAMMFEKCSELSDVTLPSTLKVIGRSAFYHCDSLEEIDIPASVETISSSAFYLTPKLTACTLHEGLKKMEDGAFRDSAITSIYIPKTLTSVSSPFYGSELSEVTFADGITELPNSLFDQAKKLTRITIPATVTKIGDRCFQGTNIESIDIPDNVTSLGQRAFADCDNLYAVTIGAGITKLPLSCFSGCDVLQNVVIPDTVTSMDHGVFAESGLCFQKLPQTMHSIPSSAFNGCVNLTAVECSDELESIGDRAFYGCANLEELRTDAESPSFYSNSFDNCPKFMDPRFYVYNPENTGVESTRSIGTDHTLVHIAVKYDIRDDWKEDTSMSSLILNLPKDLEIISSSFTAEGIDLSAVNLDSLFDRPRPGEDVYMDIRGSQLTGTLRFSAYLNNSSDALRDLTASAAFWHKHDYYNKSLGNLLFTTSKLSIFAPSTVGDQTVTVSGYTVTPDKDVTIYVSHLDDDGEAIDTVSHTVTPNSYSGKYVGEKLNILLEGQTAADEDLFEVYAESDGVKSDTVTFSYTPGAVRVAEAYEVANITKFIPPTGGDSIASYQNAHDTDVHDITGIFNSGASPVIIINPHAMYQFRIKLENDENVCHVVLMSHRHDNWKFMELHYDAASDMWIGEGYFNNNSHEYTYGQSYSPGALNLFYFYGERKDTYRSYYYGGGLAPSGSRSDLAASGEAFYFDQDGKPHGDVGDPGGTIAGSVGKAFVHGVTGKWHQVPSDVTVGGLKALWQWGNKNDNLFKTTHHGYAIDDYGNVVFPDDNKADMLNRNAEKDGRQCNIIDPAGIVYEAVKGNPVEGATATIYKLNTESGEWEEWNAADFEQDNPLLTNSDGAYAWLTDEGRFKVTISKDGYESVTSEEFDVPPEKLDLDFSLVDKTTHPTADVTKDTASGAYTIKFSKFMKPDTVNTDTVQVEGLTDVVITPVFLNEGDEYADTFTVSGTRKQIDIKISVTESAQSYSGVSAQAAAEPFVDEDHILGDADFNGNVDIRDATWIQRYGTEIDLPFTISNLTSDADGDGEITVMDASAIQYYLAQMKNPYHIGEAK